jgi:hypothetical protein
MVYKIPEEFQSTMTWRELDKEFFRYGFSVLNDSEYGVRSFWSLTFFERREFFGTVSLSETGQDAAVESAAG